MQFIEGVLAGSAFVAWLFSDFYWSWRTARVNLQAQLDAANSAILTLRENGWTSQKEAFEILEAKKAIDAAKARPRGKGGRFLSKDDAARAQGIPVDFARAVAYLHSGTCVSTKEFEGCVAVLQEVSNVAEREKRLVAEQRLGDAIENHFADRPFYDPERDA